MGASFEQVDRLVVEEPSLRELVPASAGELLHGHLGEVGVNVPRVIASRFTLVVAELKHVFDAGGNMGTSINETRMSISRSFTNSTHSRDEIDWKIRNDGSMSR